jgi:FtsZ-interacting cell division protein YlmF
VKRRSAVKNPYLIAHKEQYIILFACLQLMFHNILMGLFNWLKNGVTIEKKTEQITAKQTLDEQITAKETPPEPIAEAPEPQPEPARKDIASAILYGTPMPEPPVPPSAQQTYGLYNNYNAGFQNALSGQTMANQNLLVITPKTFDEISEILSNLAGGNPCIVSLSQISAAQRHLDYICGFMNAIGGTILQRTPVEYVLTPKGVGIKGNHHHEH